MGRQRDALCGRRPSAVALALVLLAPVPGLVTAEGSEASPGLSSGWDMLIGADGTGLPPGRGTPAEGLALYRIKCERCHGPEGRGATAEELAGGIGTLGSDNPDRTVGSYWPFAPPLFDYVRRAMPADAPFSLTNEQVYALTAYLLHLNGLIGESTVIDAIALSRLRMPNRDGFLPSPEAALVR